MKKVIGILGIMVIAVIFSLNTNILIDSESNIDLASLLSLNSANAEKYPTKMPTPKYCPNSGHYKTECSGYSANGCNSSECGDE